VEEFAADTGERNRYWAQALAVLDDALSGTARIQLKKEQHYSYNYIFSCQTHMIFHSTSVFSKKVKKSHSPLFFFLCSKHCFSEKKIWYSLGNIFVATPHTFFSRKSSFHHIQPYLGIVTSFLYNIHCYICIFHV